MQENVGMDNVEVEMLSDIDWPIIRMPGRRFPAIVVQGDSLSILAADARQIATDLRAGRRPAEEASYLAAELSRMLDRYAKALDAHDIELPYRNG